MLSVMGAFNKPKLQVSTWGRRRQSAAQNIHSPLGLQVARYTVARPPQRWSCPSRVACVRPWAATCSSLATHARCPAAPPSRTNTQWAVLQVQPGHWYAKVAEASQYELPAPACCILVASCGRRRPPALDSFRQCAATHALPI